MPDELDNTTTSPDLDDSINGAGDEEKEISDDIDPTDLPLDDAEDLPEEVLENPDLENPEVVGEDPFDLGAFGVLNDDGEFEPANIDDDEDGDEEEISEDLF